MKNTQNNSSGLGCLTIIFITVIIYIFSPETKEKRNYKKYLSETSDLIMSNIQISEDTFNSTTIYKYINSPEYINTNGFYLRVLRNSNGNLMPMTVRFQYCGNDYIKITEYAIGVDGKQVYYNKFSNHADSSEDYFPITKTDNYGNYYSSFYQTVDINYINVLYKIYNSETAIIRYIDSVNNTYYDYSITEKEKEGIKHVIDFYQLETDLMYINFKYNVLY